MYRVVAGDTGVAYDYPNRRLWKEAERVIGDMDDLTPEGRERIRAMCEVRGVSLLVEGSTWDWRRDWPERAAWCLAWSWVEPTPASDLSVDAEGRCCTVYVGSYGVEFPDRNGRDDTGEAFANAMLFANAAELLGAAKRLLAGDRKAKAALAGIVARLEPPPPVAVEVAVEDGEGV